MSESTDGYIPREGEFDPLAGENESTDQLRNHELPKEYAPSAAQHAATVEPVLQVLSLNDVLNYEPTAGAMLVGDSVIELGEIALLFGPPGSYKGFAVGHLMQCGAQGYGTWLGHSVKTQFASLWLNCENGRGRLREQFQKMKLPPDAERFIHVTDIPAIWKLRDPRLASEIRRIIIEKQIRLLIIDTVSNFVEDEFAKEFAAFFADLNSLVQGVTPRPAVLLIHHSRKPKETDKGGRGLLNLISGHQMLQRRARSICYLGRVTDEFDEQRVAAVWLKVSNNGKAEGTKTALLLADDATLQPIENFDWAEWTGSSSGGAHREPKVYDEHLHDIFEGGKRWLVHKVAAEELQERAEVGRSAAYEALKVVGGRFSHLLRKNGDGLIGLRAVELADEGGPL
jgi:hypothetical protein